MKINGQSKAPSHLHLNEIDNSKFFVLPPILRNLYGIVILYISLHLAGMQT